MAEDVLNRKIIKAINPLKVRDQREECYYEKSKPHPLDRSIDERTLTVRTGLQRFIARQNKRVRMLAKK